LLRWNETEVVPPRTLELIGADDATRPNHGRRGGDAGSTGYYVARARQAGRFVVRKLELVAGRMQMRVRACDGCRQGVWGDGKYQMDCGQQNCRRPLYLLRCSKRSQLHPGFSYLSAAQ
jgi:hypothetical protein